MATVGTSNATSSSPPRFRRRLSTHSGVTGLRDRYNYGTIIHNRVFIGGLHSSVTEDDLKVKFGNYGKISDIKIIKKPEMEKGYAFITFELQQDASKLLEQAGTRVNINGTDSKIGPAIRKPSSNESGGGTTGCASGSNQGAHFETPDIVLKPLVTPGRHRLVSVPGEEAISVGNRTPMSVPIPVPMGTYKSTSSENRNEEGAQEGGGGLVSSAPQMSAYATGQQMLELAKQKYQQEILLAQLLHAGGINALNNNALWFQAIVNKHIQQAIAQSPEATGVAHPHSTPQQQSTLFLNNSPNQFKEAAAFSYPGTGSGSPGYLQAGPNSSGPMSHPHYNTPASGIPDRVTQAFVFPSPTGNGNGSGIVHSQPQPITPDNCGAIGMNNQHVTAQQMANAVNQGHHGAGAYLNENHGMNHVPLDSNVMQHDVNANVGHAVGMQVGQYQDQTSLSIQSPYGAHMPPMSPGTPGPIGMMPGSLTTAFQFNIESNSSPE